MDLLDVGEPSVEVGIGSFANERDGDSIALDGDPNLSIDIT